MRTKAEQRNDFARTALAAMLPAALETMATLHPDKNTPDELADAQHEIRGLVAAGAFEWADAMMIDLEIEAEERAWKRDQRPATGQRVANR